MLIYFLECKAVNCTAEFYLNDIPVIRRGPEFGDAFGGPVNHLVVDGRNRLEIVIGPGPTPAQALIGADGRERSQPDAEARVRIALATYPQGAVVEGPDREEIAAHEWQALDGEACFMPRVTGTDCDLGPVLGPWQWQAAERLILDEATHREAVDFILGVHSSLVIGDFERYLRLGAGRSQEVDRSYGKAPGASNGQIRNLRADCTADPFWGMAQLRPEALNLRLCGRDRLIECLTQDWRPVLEEIPDQEESVMRYPMLIGKIDGRWQILR